MSYFPVDDGFHAHPKALRAGADALGLWVMCGAWCSRREATGDGTISAFDAETVALGMRMKDWRKSADKLVSVGLWEVVGDGWRFHDWDVHRDRDARAEDAKRKAAKRQKAYRDRSRNVTSNVTRDATENVTSDGDYEHGDATVTVTPPRAHASAGARDPKSNSKSSDPPNPQGWQGSESIEPPDPPVGDRSEQLTSLRTAYVRAVQAATGGMPPPIQARADFDALEVLWEAAKADGAETFRGWLVPKLKAWVAAVGGTPEVRFVRGYAPAKLQERLATGQDAGPTRGASHDWYTPTDTQLPPPKPRAPRAQRAPSAPSLPDLALPEPKAVP